MIYARSFFIAVLFSIVACNGSAPPDAASQAGSPSPAPGAMPATSMAASPTTVTMTMPSKPASAAMSGSAGKPATVPAADGGSMSGAGSGGKPAAGAGGVLAVAGASGAAAGARALAGTGAGGNAAPTHADLGQGDGSDVITIGDSWMNFAVNGGGIEAGLRSASMQPYRNYGVPGTQVLDEVIPNQYEQAKRDNKDIKTVVMTGGGNDLLLTGMSGNGCDTNCKSTIDKVGARLQKLWKEMSDDGVQDVIYIMYSHGGDNGDSVTYATTTVTPICAASAPLRCHLLESDPIIMMMLLDGVHPTQEGCTKLGKAVFDLMSEDGMRR